MSLWARLKNSFVAGLVLLTPLVVTLYVLRLLVGWLLQFVDPLVDWIGVMQYTNNDGLVATAVTTVLILSFVVVVGFIVQREAGRRTFGSIGQLVAFVPLVNVIYGGVRQVADALVARDSRYESVVLVEYPREGVYSIGLVTGESPPETAAVVGEGAQNVFLPNSPNPTAGRLVVLPDDQIHEIDVSVRRGLRLLVTTGITDESRAIEEYQVDR